MTSFCLEDSSDFNRKGGTLALCDHAGCTPAKPAFLIVFAECHGVSHVGTAQHRAWAVLEPAMGDVGLLGRQAAVPSCGEDAG